MFHGSDRSSESQAHVPCDRGQPDTRSELCFRKLLCIASRPAAYQREKGQWAFSQRLAQTGPAALITQLEGISWKSASHYTVLDQEVKLLFCAISGHFHWFILCLSRPLGFISHCCLLLSFLQLPSRLPQETTIIQEVKKEQFLDVVLLTLVALYVATESPLCCSCTPYINFDLGLGSCSQFSLSPAAHCLSLCPSTSMSLIAPFPVSHGMRWGKMGNLNVMTWFGGLAPVGVDDRGVPLAF